MISDTSDTDSKNFTLADFDSLEKKVDLILSQQEALQRAVAHLKADIKELVADAVKSAISKHSAEGYGRVAA